MTAFSFKRCLQVGLLVFFPSSTSSRTCIELLYFAKLRADVRVVYLWSEVLCRSAEVLKCCRRYVYVNKPACVLYPLESNCSAPSRCSTLTPTLLTCGRPDPTIRACVCVCVFLCADVGLLLDPSVPLPAVRHVSPDGLAKRVREAGVDSWRKEGIFLRSTIFILPS